MLCCGARGALLPSHGSGMGRFGVVSYLGAPEADSRQGFQCMGCRETLEEPVLGLGREPRAIIHMGFICRLHWPQQRVSCCWEPVVRTSSKGQEGMSLPPHLSVPLTTWALSLKCTEREPSPCELCLLRFPPCLLASLTSTFLLHLSLDMLSGSQCPRVLIVMGTSEGGESRPPPESGGSSLYTSACRVSSCPSTPASPALSVTFLSKLVGSLACIIRMAFWWLSPKISLALQDGGTHFLSQMRLRRRGRQV